VPDKRLRWEAETLEPGSRASRVASKRAAGRANQVRIRVLNLIRPCPTHRTPGGVQAEPGSSVCGERPETLEPGSRASPVASKRVAGCANRFAAGEPDSSVSKFEAQPNLIRSRPNQIRAFRT
jgi:hypothetical protein